MTRGRARLAALAGLAVVILSVYLAARHVAPWAAAFVAGLATLAVALLYESHAQGIGRALECQARLASIDDLTGLANDRSFREAMRSPRIGRSLALIDVDRFKLYNDAFGHPAGDAALREIGEILAGVVGGSNGIYRVGGDEFAILILGDEGANPTEAAESIVRKVADHPWSLRPITVSVGLASVDESGGSNPLDRADQALYRAKRAGGNRVVAGLQTA